MLLSCRKRRLERSLNVCRGLSLTQVFPGSTIYRNMDTTLENWALFEPFQINVRDPETVSVDDRDLQVALRLHSLRFKE